MEIKEIEKRILEISIKICRRGEGGAIFLGDELRDYDFMVPQKFDSSTNVFDDPKTIESLALQDGLVWIDSTGNLRGYGIAIINISVVLNKGTRHASVLSASKQGNNKIFLVSQEDKKIKIYHRGELILQVDPYEKDVKESLGEAVDLIETINEVKQEERQEEKKMRDKPDINVIESIGVGTAGAAGTAMISPIMNIVAGQATTAQAFFSSIFQANIIPGVLIFGTIYTLARIYVKSNLQKGGNKIDSKNGK